MSKKRRVFNIDFPEDEAPEIQPVSPSGETKSRRSPMASAISETADSVRDRQGLEAEIRAENDALAHEHVRLKNEGLIISRIPLQDIFTTKLIRDRSPIVDDDLDELIDSICEIGLSNPIRVEAREDGKYELVQGYRRLTAYKALHARTREDAYATIPATVSAEGDALEVLYRRMVDENLVRKDISFAEMAQLAMRYAADPATKINDPDKAVAELFASAGYQKRSYIRAFIPLLDAIGEALKYPDAISRALGLDLRKAIDETPGLAKSICEELFRQNVIEAEEEIAVLRRFVKDEPRETFPAGKLSKAGAPRKAKSVFSVETMYGTAKCTASDGRFEIKLPHDFGDMERARLEAAVAEFLAAIDGDV